MKATLIFASLFLFAALMGCSDSISVNEQFKNETASTRNPGDERNIQQVASFEHLTVYSGSDIIAENKAVFNNPPLEMISNYWVTFDVYTDANKLTNGFIPVVRILCDGATMFESTDYPDGSIVTPEKVALKNVRFNSLVISVTLMQGDTPGALSNIDAQKMLRLSRIKIYKEN